MAPKRQNIASKRPEWLPKEAKVICKHQTCQKLNMASEKRKAALHNCENGFHKPKVLSKKPNMASTERQNPLQKAENYSSKKDKMASKRPEWFPERKFGVQKGTNRKRLAKDQNEGEAGFQKDQSGFRKVNIASNDKMRQKSRSWHPKVKIAVTSRILTTKAL